MIEPFQEAVARLDSKTPVGAALRSAEWAEVPQAIRERAFFSATVTQLHVLQEMQDIISEAVTLNPADAFADKSRFVADMRSRLGAAPGDSGSITDITSRRRLELIYDFQLTEVNEFGRHKIADSPELLDAFPARELVRVEGRSEERSWPAIWRENGGRMYEGRMIAPKGDPIWLAISQFGRPYPPFRFGSGMGIADVARREAERLGVIERGEPAPEPESRKLNEGLQQSVRGLSPDKISLLETLFQGAININGMKAALNS